MAEAFSIEITNVNNLIANLTAAQQKQIPFAISRTVNTIAYTIQRDTIDRLLPEKFILRTKWWRPGTKTGVNYFPSNKRQTPIRAIVNTLASFMELQETGGIKKPRPGEAYIPIPTWNAQPNPHQLIRANRRYKALTMQAGTVINKKTGAKSRGAGSVRTLMHQGNPWISTLKNGQPSIAVRLTKDRTPIAVMYIGKDSVTIKPRFGFRKNARRIFDADYRSIFQREFRAAMATAKI